IRSVAGSGSGHTLTHGARSHLAGAGDAIGRRTLGAVDVGGHRAVARGDRRRPRLLDPGGQTAHSSGAAAASAAYRPREHVVMKMDVSSAVISDLWPVYASGEASPESRALVEAFLAADPAFAQALRDSSGVTLVVAK